MAYTKQTWKSLPDTSTPITSERLNHIEDGIESANTNSDINTTNISELQTNVRNLQTSTQTNTTNIEALQTTTNELNTKVQTNTTDISSLETQLKNISTNGSGSNFTYVKYNGDGKPALTDKDKERLKTNDYYMDMNTSKLYQYNGSEFILVGNVDDLGLKFYIVNDKLYYGGYGTDSFSEIQQSYIISMIKTLGLDQDTWSSTKTYSIGDIVVDNYQLYENITGTNTTTKPSEDTTNWKLTSILVDE